LLRCLPCFRSRSSSAFVGARVPASAAHN
jgi:hypothetical protein